MDLKNAKVAVTSDDGANVTSHFGRAPFYVVLTIQDGKVVAREQRSKIAPHNAERHEEGHQHNHGHNHSQMVEPILDCQAVVARGMGDGAYVHLTQAGLTT
ncbi:MAG: NifB/NifX family molybdenum-iron cluster-binding protein, partial [Bacteroidota bacterium]